MPRSLFSPDGSMLRCTDMSKLIRLLELLGNDKYDFSEEVDNLRISLSSQNDCNWNLITTEEEVRRIFASQNPSKAAGPDNVSPRVLKLC